MSLTHSFAIFLLCQWTSIHLSRSQSTEVLFPKKIQVRKGTRSSQKPTVLQTNELTNSEEDPSTYIEFRPTGTKKHKSVFKFPALSLDGDKVSAFSFKVNMRGPSKDVQKWKFRIRNFQTKMWESLFVNKQGSENQWYIQQNGKSVVVGTFGGNYQHRKSRQIWMQLSSNNKVDNIDLDYIALTITMEDIPLLSPGTTWTYDIGGYHGQPYDTSVVMIDLFDTSDTLIDSLKSEGKVVCCYFSAGTFEDWREDANEFDESILGNPMDEWEGEKWLDIRSGLTLEIMNARMMLAQEKGCQALEPDNVDGYINETGFSLSKDDQMTYLTNLAQTAGSLGLLIGLKNADDLVKELEPIFDFSIAEECYKYNECCDYLPFVTNNKPVFAIEYGEKDEEVCGEFKTRNYSPLFGNYELSDLSFCSSEGNGFEGGGFDGC